MKEPRREPRLYAAVALVAAILFLPLLAHPTRVVFDGTSDLIAGHLPYRILLARSLRHAEGLPAYDPTAFAGIPLAADPQSNLTYPLNWVHALSEDGAPAAFGWLMLLHVLIAGWGVLFWLGPRGFDAPARLAAALAFMLAGKWLHHVLSSGHVNMLPLAWVPLQLALIDRLFLCARWRYAAGLAVATALVINGSHPQLTLYTQVLVVAYALLALARSGKIGIRRGLPALLAAAALGLALSAWYLLPILTGLDFFVRGSGLDFLDSISGALGTKHLVGAVLPREARDASNFVIFMGSATLALAGFAPAMRSDRSTTWFFLATFLLTVSYAMGYATPLLGFVNSWIPGFSLFRRPARILLLAGLPLGWLAGAGLMALRREPLSRVVYALAFALLLCGLALVIYQPGVATVWAATGFALPALLLGASFVRLQRAAGWVVVFVIACQLLHYSCSLVETRNVSEVLAPNALAESLQQPLGRGRVLSINVFPMLSAPFEPDVNARYGIEGLRGYNPLVPRRTRELLRRVGAKPEERVPQSAARIPVPRLESRLPLDLLNTQWVISPIEIGLEGLALRMVHTPEASDPERGTSPMAFPGRRFVYENTRRMPRAALVRRARLMGGADGVSAAHDDWNPRVEVLVEDADLAGGYPGNFEVVPVERHGDGLDLEVDAGQGGYLVISEFDYPGWKARVDGRPVALHRANDFFLGLRLGGGEHHVELVYRPRALVIGFWITLAGLAGTAGLLLIDGDRGFASRSFASSSDRRR